MPHLAFFLSVIYWPGLLSAAVAPRWSLMALGLPLVSRLDPRCLAPWAQAGMALWLAYGLLTLLWAPDAAVGFNDLCHTLILALVLIAAAGIEDIAPVLVAASAGVAISAPIAIAQMFGWTGIFDQGAIPAGLFFNRNILAETAAPLFVWCLLTRRIGLSTVLAIPLLICESRVAISAVFIVMILSYPKKLGWLALLVAYLVLAAALGRLPISADKLHSFDLRKEIWNAALGGLTLYGSGLGAFMAEHPYWEYVHSDALQAVYELGIGSLAPIILCGKGIFHRTPESIALAVLVVEACISFPLHMPMSAFLVFLLAGFLARDGDRIRNLGHVGRTVALAAV